MAEKLTLTVPETARQLGIGTALAWEAVWTGRIPSILIGRRRLVPIAALRKMLEQNGTERAKE